MNSKYNSQSRALVDNKDKPIKQVIKKENLSKKQKYEMQY